MSGKATVDGSALETGALLDGEHWVELEAGSSVALRHTLTSREFKLVGPGLMLPCRQGFEQVLIARGQISTSANLGVRPGAEVLIATPSGTVHYGDAALEAEFGPKGLHVRVIQGEAWVESAGAGVLPFKNPVRSGEQAALSPSRTDSAGLVEACKIAAESARESGLRVLSERSVAPAPSIGARAAAHMRDRTAARAACAIAAAAAGSVADPAERQSLWASIAHSDDLWHSVPRATSTQKN